MRPVLSAFILAAVTAGPAVAEPFITPGVVAGMVVPALVEAAIASGANGGRYAAAPGYASPSGDYVQYYDPRSGVPVGGPVPVSPDEFAWRSANVPADAPVIRVRPGRSVTHLGIEPVGRPALRGVRYGAAAVVAPGAYGYGPRYGAGVFRPRVFGPRYGAGVYGPRYGAGVYGGAYGPRYGAGVFRPRGYGAGYGAGVYGPRYRAGVGYGRPIYAGPRRLAPAPFRHGGHVPGYAVVPRRGGVAPVRPVARGAIRRY